MFGQASPRCLTSTSLVLMVAFFGVHLNSHLYLASPVTDNLNDFTDMMSARPHGNTTDSTTDVAKCMANHINDIGTCEKKALKEDFAEITEEKCSNLYALTKCAVEILCKFCKDDNIELNLKEIGEFQEEDLRKLKEKCKPWESKAPKVPTNCPESERSGFFSDNQGLVIYIIVGVVLVVAVVIAVVVYCLMCTGDSKGRSAKPGKSSKGSKSMKAGKSNKSSIKGGKSTKSSKSRKSGKSLKGGKSTKSSKGSKSKKSSKK